MHFFLEEAYHGTERQLQLSTPGGQPRNVRVRIPSGAVSGRRLRVPGKGQASVHGPAGDLYLIIEVAPHALYRLEGKDIYLDTPVTPWEAALGTSLVVPTLAGNVRLKVPAGAKSGQKLRLPGKGMPSPDGVGDGYVVLQIALPPELSEAERDLYEQLRAASSHDTRPHFPKGSGLGVTPDQEARVGVQSCLRLERQFLCGTPRRRFSFNCHGGTMISLKPLIVASLAFLTGASAQEMAFQGKWKLIKDRSSDLDYFQYLTFQCTVNPGEITIVKELGPKRKAAETMVLKTNGAVNSVSVVDRTFTSNLYMGLKLPSESKKEVTATWKNNLLVIHERYPVIAS